MSRLEEKLAELGYTNFYVEDSVIYFKWVNENWRISFRLNKVENVIKDATLGIGTKEISKDEVLLQQAFNVMQKDLEELEKYEKL